MFSLFLARFRIAIENYPPQKSERPLQILKSMHAKCVERSRLLHSLITEKNNNATTLAFSQQEKQKLIHNQRERDQKVLREMKQTPVVHVSCQSVFFLFSVVFFGFLSFIVFDCIYRFFIVFYCFLSFFIVFYCIFIVFYCFFIVFYCFFIVFLFLSFFIVFYCIFIVFYCFLLYFLVFIVFCFFLWFFLLFSIVFLLVLLSKISVLLLSTQSNACIVYIC